MVTKKAAGKKPGKLKLKKETLKDLDSKGNVKGGFAVLVRPGRGLSVALATCGGVGTGAGGTIIPRASIPCGNI